MITILHGENLVASRNELTRFKSEFQGEVITLDGKNLSETDFIQASQSGSMFANSRLVIIEGMPKFDLSQAVCGVVIWEDKKVTPPAGVKNLEFKISQSIWKFLNNPTVLNFREALKDNDVQFLFIMFCRQYKGDRGKLLDLDYKYKTGQLATDFPTAIELFLLGIYDE